MGAMESLEGRTLFSLGQVTDIVMQRVVNTSAQWGVNLNGGTYLMSVQVLESRRVEVDVAGHRVSADPPNDLLIVSLDAADAGAEGSLDGGPFSAAGAYALGDVTFTRDGVGGAHLKAELHDVGIDVGTGVLFDMSLDLTWKGKGATTVQRASDRQTFDDQTILTFVTDQTRNATLSGRAIATELNGNRPGRVTDLSPRFAATATPVMASISDARELDVTATAMAKAGLFAVDAMMRRDELFG
jgi:hypothetical protein